MSEQRAPMGRRLAAIATLVLGFGLLVALVFLFVTHWYAVILAVVAAAVVATGVTRFLATASPRRHGWMATALVGVGGLVVAVVLVAYDRPIALGAFIVVGSVTGTLGLYAQRGYVRVAAAPEVSGPRRVLRSRRAVLFLNPKSGGGKVGQFDLVAEARRREVETVELGPDDDLTALATQAVADGAEVLGMAGGDGSQADVAAVAVAHDLPFVCIPAGTRNHFALDLNLDRSDPRLALDAFVEGIERRVDYGRAGDRFFVNNVSLGVYPYIVQDPSYRDGPLKAAADLLPDLLDPERTPVDLRFTSPSGTNYRTAQALLVSNNPYRSGVSLDGTGRRVSLDGGELGILVVAVSDPAALAAAMRNLALGAGVDRVHGLDQWTSPSLRVESGKAMILAGVDGEAMDLPSPLEIRVVPRGLRVIVPMGTPEPPAPADLLLSTQALGDLLSLAGGIDIGPFGDDQ